MDYSKQPKIKIKHLGKKKFKINWINWHNKTVGIDVTEGVIPEGKVEYTFNQIIFPNTKETLIEEMAQKLMNNPQFQSSEPITVLSLIVSALTQAHNAGKEEGNKQWVNDIIDAFGSLVPVSGVEANNPQALADLVEEVLVNKGKEAKAQEVVELVEGMAPALKALKDYKQADEDGVMVLTSRQAIDEIYNTLTDIKNHLNE